MNGNPAKRGLQRLFDRWNHRATFKLSWPTRITLMRILLIVPFVECMLNTHNPQLSESTQDLLRYVAMAIFFVMAISDGIDGYLARRRKQITKLGAFLDPLADKLLITSASLLLVSQRGHVAGFLLPVTVVVLIIGKDILITIGFIVVYLITSQTHIVVLAAPELAAVIPGYRWFLSVLWWSAAGAALLAALIYIRNGSRYIEQYERALSKDSSG